MEKFRTVILFLCVGLVAGCMCGIVTALPGIHAQAYWTYGMYVLIAETLAPQIIAWMAAGALAYALCGAVVTLSAQAAAAARIAAAAAYAAVLCAAVGAAALMLPAVSIAAAACMVVIACMLLFAESVRRHLLARPAAVVGLALPGLLLCAAAFVWPAVQGLRSGHDAPSIVLIVVDCLRADHLGCHGYARDTSPAIDALAGVGRHFERAYVPSPWTKPTVASLFTSRLPARHGLVNPDHRAPDRLLLLAEVLRNAGYTNFLINGGNVFLKEEFNLHQGFHQYDYLPQRTYSADDVALTFLDRASAAGQARYFAYVHFMDAHAPYTVNQHNTLFAEQIREDFPPGDPATLLSLQRAANAPGRTDPDLQRYFRDLYDGQIRAVDDAIAMMLQGLALLDRLDNTVFIITSDHGEEFWEHGSAEHGHTLYNELLHVPLIIAGSPIEHARIKEPVQLIDIMPTVLDLAGISRDRLSLQGVSLAPGSTLPADRALFASGTLYGSESYCVMRDNWKLIYRSHDAAGKWSLSGPQAPAGYQLFDLSRDPGEQHDLAGTIDIPSELEDLLADYITTESMEISRQSVMVIDDDMRRQLQSLGYIQ